jgi:hypothetical protein
VYQGSLPSAIFQGIHKLGVGFGASVAGAVVQFTPSDTEPNQGIGSYAVTG